MIVKKFAGVFHALELYRALELAPASPDRASDALLRLLSLLAAVSGLAAVPLHD